MNPTDIIIYDSHRGPILTFMVPGETLDDVLDWYVDSARGDLKGLYKPKEGTEEVDTAVVYYTVSAPGYNPIHGNFEVYLR